MDHRPPLSPTLSESAFDLYGPPDPDRPVILSVPHAARLYPEELLAQARVRPQLLQRLEDRFADLLIHPLLTRGFTAIVARAPRAMIDLNRHEREIDAAMIADLPRSAVVESSAKLRGGLGLFPRRLPGAPELWQRPLAWAEARERIDAFHRPYHAMLGRLMVKAREAHGHAILIDLHSMPSLPTVAGGGGPMVVLGDRFGRSASGRVMALAAEIAGSHGLSVAQNHPYAGDYLIERHGRPDRHVHALQVEIDRALYLDAGLDQPGAGLVRTQALVTDLAEALAVELPRAGYAMAAE